MSTLYELTGQYLLLEDMMDDPDVDEQTLLDTLEGIEGELQDKADGYAKVMRNLEAEAAALKEESDRILKRKRAIDKNIDRMKAALQQSMVLTGYPKFKTNLFSFAIQKNPPKLVIDRESTEHAPEEFIIIQAPIWNKEKLKEALKNGEDVDGIAHLEQGESLRIR